MKRILKSFADGRERRKNQMALLPQSELRVPDQGTNETPVHVIQKLHSSLRQPNLSFYRTELFPLFRTKSSSSSVKKRSSFLPSFLAPRACTRSTPFSLFVLRWIRTTLSVWISSPKGPAKEDFQSYARCQPERDFSTSHPHNRDLMK